MKKYKNIMRTIAIVIVVCAIPAGCGIFLFSHITNVTTSATIGEIGTIILSLISVVITILLGYFVYMQSERIHALEETQYDVFLGVEKIDTSISFPSEMLLLCKSTSSDIRLFEGIVCNDLSLYAHTTLIKGCSSATVLPLVITTRNTPLITALCLKEINLSVDYFDCVQDKTSNRKEVFSITDRKSVV